MTEYVVIIIPYHMNILSSIFNVLLYLITWFLPFDLVFLAVLYSEKGVYSNAGMKSLILKKEFSSCYLHIACFETETTEL